MSGGNEASNAGTDLAAFRLELGEVVAKLNHLYTGFDPERPQALAGSEAEIVALHNRYHALTVIIAKAEKEEKTAENILAGFALVEQLRGRTSS